MSTTEHPTKHPTHPDGFTAGPRGTKVIQTEAAARAQKASHPQEHSGLKIAPAPGTEGEEGEDDTAGEEECADAER